MKQDRIDYLSSFSDGGILSLFKMLLPKQDEEMIIKREFLFVSPRLLKEKAVGKEGSQFKVFFLPPRRRRIEAKAIQDY